ncbi:hypothetical protein QC764_0003610 [Podospora pseudoanserina]|uniref:Uncharacterized protein n=1 Tax=Podospora pseudoanserina TaxID=2609844 RepID=A0ABR0IKR3_9PEZI|nr:hypothetical protein QC764_0003610 [Podospora pseudoanserina]
MNKPPLHPSAGLGIWENPLSAGFVIRNCASQFALSKAHDSLPFGTSQDPNCTTNPRPAWPILAKAPRSFWTAPPLPV